jgi:hypothetical protein
MNDYDVKFDELDSETVDESIAGLCADGLLTPALDEAGNHIYRSGLVVLC